MAAAGWVNVTATRIAKVETEMIDFMTSSHVTDDRPWISCKQREAGGQRLTVLER